MCIRDRVKVISIAPDGKIALSIKQTQPAPERAPRAPRSPRPQGQQLSLIPICIMNTVHLNNVVARLKKVKDVLTVTRN